MHLFHCLTFLLLFTFCVAKDTVPTFLIDYDQVMADAFVGQNPYTRTSPQVFADIVQDTMKHCAVLIIFVEETLCTEDISMKDGRGTPFSYLHDHLTSVNVQYLPNVVNPMKVLTQLLPKTVANVFVLSPGQTFQPSGNLKFFYVFFDDHGSRANRFLNESRVEMLRRHDEVMEHVYKTTRKIAHGAVISFYTGKNNPVLMLSPESRPSDNSLGFAEQDVILISKGAMFRFIGLTVSSEDRLRRMSIVEEPPTVTDQSDGVRQAQNNATVVSKVKFNNFDLQFTFTVTDTHWILENIKFIESDDVLGEITMELSAPANNSLYCDEPIIIVNYNKNKAVVIPEYQIQAFGRSESSPQEFGKPIRCSPYFSIPILTALLVTAFLLSILLFALYTLHCCLPNDRFDDPNRMPLIAK